MGNRFDASTAEERLDALEQLVALLHATTAEVVELVAAADRAEDWAIDGATGVVPWLVAMFRVSSQRAREWARVGSALESLPAIRSELARGGLSWDQAAPGTKVATPETDELLARELQGCTAAQVEALARQHRPRRSEDELEALRRQRLSWRFDHALGGQHLYAFLPGAEAEAVVQGITREAEALGPDAETGLWAPFEHRAAQALVRLAEQRIVGDHDPDACLTVVHVDADVLDGTAAGNGTVGGVAVGVEGVRRLMCDGKVELVAHRGDGEAVGIGRASRVVPRWLRRVVTERDGTCRFPGCGRRIRDAHHLQHWTAEGPTDISNLTGLCWSHHHLVHDGGWTVEGDPQDELRFTAPGGRRVLTSRPATLSPTVRRRARRAAGLEPDP